MHCQQYYVLHSFSNWDILTVFSLQCQNEGLLNNVPKAGSMFLAEDVSQDSVDPCSNIITITVKVLHGRVASILGVYIQQEKNLRFDHTFLPTYISIHFNISLNTLPFVLLQTYSTYCYQVNICTELKKLSEPLSFVLCYFLK